MAAVIATTAPSREGANNKSGGRGRGGERRQGPESGERRSFGRGRGRAQDLRASVPAASGHSVPLRGSAGAPASTGSSSSPSSSSSSSSSQAPDRSEAAERFRQRFKKELEAIEEVERQESIARAKRDRLLDQMDGFKVPNTAARERRDHLRGALSSVRERRQAIIAENKLAKAKATETAEMYKNRREALKSQANDLAFPNLYNPQFVEKNMLSLDAEKKKLERIMQEEQLSTKDERQLIAKLNELEKRRSLVRDLEQKRQALEASRSRVTPEKKKEADVVWDGLNTEETALKEEFEQVRLLLKKNKDAHEAMFLEVNAIREHLRQLAEQKKLLNKQLTEKKEADIQQRKLKQQRAQQEREARMAERKRIQEERARQEALILPHELELSIIKSLVEHLKSLLKIKREDKFVHPLRIYNAFEILSLSPPRTHAEVTQCLQLVEEKRAHFKAVRKAERAKRALAEKLRLEAEQNASQPSSSSEFSTSEVASASQQEQPAPDTPAASAHADSSSSETTSSTPSSEPAPETSESTAVAESSPTPPTEEEEE